MSVGELPRRIGIVGLGLMGASLAMALRRSDPGIRLAGVDTDATVLARALERGYVDEASAELGSIAGCGLVVLAVPISAMENLLPQLRAFPGVVTDVCSTKSDVVSWAAQAGVDLVPGHPMCGRELSGIDAARQDLFEGAPWILTREDPMVLRLVETVGGRPLVLDAAEHDRLIGGVSHAAFVLAAAYMLSLSRSPDWPELASLAAGGFRDMTRLAAGDPAMYEVIAHHNANNIDSWLDRFEAALAELRRLMHSADGGLGRDFEEAKVARDRWAGRRQ